MKKSFFFFKGGVPAGKLLELQKSLQILAAAANTEELLKAAGETALAVVPAEDTVMLLYSPGQGSFYLRMTSQGEGTWASPCLWRPGELGAEFKRLLPPQPHPLHLSHLSDQDPLQQLFNYRPLGSLLACPLYRRSDYWGVLLWGAKRGEGFNDEDQILADLFSTYLSSCRLILASKGKGEKALQEAQKSLADIKERLYELEESKISWQKERAHLLSEYRRMAKTLEESTTLATKELVEAYRRLEDESHSQVQRQLQSLVRREVEKAVRAFFDLGLLLELILEFCLEELKAQTGSIMLLDPETGTLRIKAAKGLPREVVEQTQIPLGKAIAGFVALEGQPLLIADIENEPHFAKISNQRYNTRSLLSVPIKNRSGVIGVINVNNKRSGEIFIKEDLDLLLTLAGQAGLVIENTSHFEGSQGEQEIKSLYEVYLGKAILDKIALGGQVPELAAGSYNVALLYVDLRTSASLDIGDRTNFTEIIRELLRIINRHRGRIVKGLGEGILALFGEPIPQNDDAERALRAAEEILINQSRQAGFLEGRAVGLGLHCGPIFCQRVMIDGQEEEVLLGETVKVAATLGQRASENCFYMTEEYFEKIQSQPEASALILESILVEGIPNPVYACRPYKF